MNTKLLRKVKYRRRLGSNLVWALPGYVTPIVFHRCHSSWGVPAASWPHRDSNGHIITRAARLDWHRNVAKDEIRKLLRQVAETLDFV